jgi:histidyl-tRNA synthetase
MASVLAEQLREQGLRVVLHCGGGSFKSQMKKADASGAHCGGCSVDSFQAVA